MKSVLRKACFVLAVAAMTPGVAMANNELIGLSGKSSNWAMPTVSRQ